MSSPERAQIASEPAVSRRLAALILAVLAMLVIVLVPAGAQAATSGTFQGSTGSLEAAPAPAPEPEGTVDDPVLEVLDLTNQSRNNHGRHDLILDEDLSAYAAKHSRWMADHKSLTHTKNLAKPLNDNHINWHHAGENIGVCTNVGDTSCLKALQDAFMRSTGHRHNILDPDFDHVGIGVAKQGARYWVTVSFYG